MRSGVAFNELTPIEVLIKLSEDKHPEVLSGVAGNESTPFEVLNKLSKNGDAYVRDSVAANKSTPPEILKKMCKDVNDVRLELAQNPSLPLDSLIVLIGDIEPEVRIAALRSYLKRIKLITKKYK